MNLYNVEFNILLDTASSVTLITKDLAKIFQLRTYKLENPFNITSINGSQVILARRYCVFDIPNYCTLKCILVDRICETLPGISLPSKLKTEIIRRNLKLVQNICSGPTEVHILVGTE